jgi:hypothetical protein
LRLLSVAVALTNGLKDSAAAITLGRTQHYSRSHSHSRSDSAQHYSRSDSANRATFVVDRDGTVKEIVTGNEAIDPKGAVAACPVR